MTSTKSSSLTSETFLTRHLVYALLTMSTLLLPPPLPEKDRKAAYDYRVNQDTFEIVQDNGADVEVIWSSKGAQALISSDTDRLHSRRWEYVMHHSPSPDRYLASP
jgi:hypothetical protein